jgi:hypothetical protein
VIRALAAVMFAIVAGAADARDGRARAAFVRDNPCPATGQARGACPGYVVDHIKPLCASGADDPANMQWQTIAEAKVKDREEQRICRELRQGTR